MQLNFSQTEHTWLNELVNERAMEMLAEEEFLTAVKAQLGYETLDEFKFVSFFADSYSTQLLTLLAEGKDFSEYSETEAEDEFKNLISSIEENAFRDAMTQYVLDSLQAKGLVTASFDENKGVVYRLTDMKD